MVEAWRLGAGINQLPVYKTPRHVSKLQAIPSPATFFFFLLAKKEKKKKEKKKNKSLGAYFFSLHVGP